MQKLYELLETTIIDEADYALHTELDNIRLYEELHKLEAERDSLRKHNRIMQIIQFCMANGYGVNYSPTYPYTLDIFVYSDSEHEWELVNKYLDGFNYGFDNKDNFYTIDIEDYD